MSNQTDVTITNRLSGDIIVALRQPDGGIALQETITQTNEVKVNLADLSVSLDITGPEGVDYDKCPVVISSEIPMNLKHYRTTRKWTLKISPNETQPNLPHTVKVTLGPEEDD